MRGMDLFFTNTIGERGNCSTCHQGPLFSTATFPFTEEEESGEFPERSSSSSACAAVTASISPRTCSAISSAGRARSAASRRRSRRSRELPSIYPATVGGDLTLNGVPCTVESFLMNQDRTQPPTDAGRDPPEPPGRPTLRTTARRTRVVSGCGMPGRRWNSRSRLIDGGPGNDTATIRPVIFGGAAAPLPGLLPDPAVYGARSRSVRVDGDFTLEIPTRLRHGVL